MRTSLARVPSAFTDDQQQAHREAYEREIWHKHEHVVVDLRHPPRDLPRLVTMALEAWAQRRFGKRGV